MYILVFTLLSFLLFSCFFFGWKSIFYKGLFLHFHTFQVQKRRVTAWPSLPYIMNSRSIGCATTSKHNLAADRHLKSRSSLTCAPILWPLNIILQTMALNKGIDLYVAHWHLAPWLLSVLKTSRTGKLEDAQGMTAPVIFRTNSHNNVRSMEKVTHTNEESELPLSAQTWFQKWLSPWKACATGAASWCTKEVNSLGYLHFETFECKL